MVLVQFPLDALLLTRQPVQRGIQIILIEPLGPQHIGHRVLTGPAHRRQPRPAVGNARQGQEQDPPAFRRGAQHPRDADLIGQVLEREQHTENLAAGHLPARPAVEFPLAQPLHRRDPLRRPLRQVGEGARLDLAALAVRLAEQNGGLGVTVGDASDEHGDDIHRYSHSDKAM